MADERDRIENASISVLSASQALWSLGAVIFFVAILYANSSATAERVNRQSAVIQEIQRSISQIQIDLAEIKGMLRGKK
jgi:hypothetical protein